MGLTFFHSEKWKFSFELHLVFFYMIFLTKFRSCRVESHGKYSQLSLEVLKMLILSIIAKMLILNLNSFNYMNSII